MMPLKGKLPGWAIRATSLAAMLAILNILSGLALLAAPPTGSRWATGTAFARQLESAVDIRWQDAPFRESVQRLARAQRVAIVVDRRIDPDQGITTHVSQRPLIEALRAECEPRGWDVSVLSPVLYIGPRDAVRPLATWYAQQVAALSQLPASRERSWRRVSDASWPALTEPRRLLASWLDEARITVSGLEQVPHDLWSAQELPPLDLLQRLTIVLAGFQLAARVETDGHVQIIRLPNDLRLTRDYRVPTNRQTDVATLRKQLPDAELTETGARLEVTGRAEDHAFVRAWLKEDVTRGTSSPRLQDKRFTLSVQNQPIEAILQAIAAQSDLALVWQAKPQVRQRRVSLSVENVTFGELLRTVLEGQPAAFRLKAQQLIITDTDAEE